jgi:hypothetical protein
LLKFQKLIDKECVYDYLGRLNIEYDQIRVHVLGKSLSLPFLEVDLFSCLVKGK